jgi:hypothetical protein
MWEPLQLVANGDARLFGACPRFFIADVTIVGCTSQVACCRIFNGNFAESPDTTRRRKRNQQEKPMNQGTSSSGNHAFSLA